MTVTWDPEQYLRYEAERARAFHDLVAQVDHPSPRSVVDLGCGPGHLTATLAERWSEAEVTGVDSAAEMIEEARTRAIPGRLDFLRGSIEQWAPQAPASIVISNAALQWVPSHVDLLARWVREAVAPGGTLAFSMPASGGSAASVAIRQVAASPRWADLLGAVALRGPGPRAGRSAVRTADEYLDLLAELGCRVNVWETTYLHVLPGTDPVLHRFAGTGLRPYLDALPEDEHPEFQRDVAAALVEAYPPADYGTVLPFRRIFVIAGTPWMAR